MTVRLTSSITWPSGVLKVFVDGYGLAMPVVPLAGTRFGATPVVMTRPQPKIAPAWNGLSSRANSFQSPFALALPKLLKLELVTEPGPGAGQTSPVP